MMWIKLSINTGLGLIELIIGIILGLIGLKILLILIRTVLLSIILLITPWKKAKIQNIKKDFKGVYIWRIKKHFFFKKVVYVGQSINVKKRINQHLTGKGSPEIYKCKRKKNLEIKLIKISHTGYSDLDALEKRLISKYDTYYNGFNKTSGNGKHKF